MIKKYNFIIKYPFSTKAKQFIESKHIDVFHIDDEIIKKTITLFIKTINQNTNELENQWAQYIKLDDERIALLFAQIYPVSKILINIIDFAPLNSQLAKYYQKQLNYYLRNCEDDEELKEIITDIIPEIDINEEKQEYTINLVDYLKYELGEDYKLQYTNLENGKIYFQSKKEIINLASAILKKKILTPITIDTKQIPKIFIEASNYIKSKIIKENTFDIKIINKQEIDKFPPCFLKLYNDLISGKKLNHLENYTLGIFLVRMKYSYEEIINLYRNLPNFDEKISSYQIKKLIEKNYNIPNCDTLKSNGICVQECGVKHPLQLIYKQTKTEKGKYENNKN